MDLAGFLSNRDNWAIISSIATTASVFFLVIGPRLKVVRNWIGEGLQEMLGVTGLREDQREMHESNQSRFGALEDGQSRLARNQDTLAKDVVKLTTEVESHHSDLEIHLRRGHT